MQNSTRITSRRKRWLIPVIFLLGIVLAVYAKHKGLKHAAIAFGIYHAHVFTPPSMQMESWWGRFRESAEFYWDVARLEQARDSRLRQLIPTLRPLVKDIGRRQAAGEGMQYSMHIYREIRWLLNYTPHVSETRAQIAELRHSLTLPPSQQHLATEQQASDGSWGLGFTSWYFRLYYSVDDIQQCRANPRYPFSFLDRINSPEKLTALLNSDLMDNFTKTGEFNEDKLNETFSALARILMKNKPTTCYGFHPGLRTALKDFVTHWQNPATGWWGQWLVDRQGRIWKMDDVSITFHAISDLFGQVPHLDRIAKHLLQVDGVNFPAGIRFNGHYENHLNWDAVKIFRTAWPTLDASTREQARAEISRMLHWCLTKSYQPDGSFKVSDLDDTLGDAYEYGVNFLVDAGYFNRAKRFWTNQDFPNAETVRDRIETKLKSIGLHDGFKDAYQTLETGES
jgi:hypothetical protein